MKTILALIGVLVALFMVAPEVLLLRSPERKISHAPKVDKESIGYKMAYIETNGRVSDSDPLIDEFSNRVASISKRTGETPIRVADMTVRGWDDVRKKGLNVSLLEFTQEAHEATQTKVAVPYATTVYLLVRVYGSE